MPNIHIVNDEVLTSELYNVLFGTMDGHFRYWYHIPTGKIVVKQIGDYHTLISSFPIHGAPRPLTAEEDAEIRPCIERDLRYACRLDNRGNVVEYLLPKSQAAYKKQGRLSFRDRAFRYPWADFPESDYYEEFNGAKTDAENEAAIQLLTAAGTRRLVVEHQTESQAAA